MKVHTLVYLQPSIDLTDVTSTEELKKKWAKWDEATFDSHRLQFRVIDLNEDGLIDFNEL